MDRAVGHCGLLIGCGSRDEHPEEHGLAHYLEHCLFKGTAKRTNAQILSRLDSVGGEINAFTAKEETWIHASFLKEHIDRALELIADIALHSNFPAAEIEKEKDVIIDEINGYKDSPSDMLFEELDEYLYPGHPLGKSILGTVDSVKSFKRKHLMEFYQRNFLMQNMVFSFAGPISGEKLKAKLEVLFSKNDKRMAAALRPEYYPYKKTKKRLYKDIHQAHYCLACTAPGLHQKDRHAFTLLNNLLGGPAMNNILNLNIREKHGIAYQVDSNYSPFSDTGAFSIYLGTETYQLEKALHLIHKELSKLREKALSTTALNGYKKQLMGQLALSQDSGASIMFNHGKSVWVYDKISPMEEIFDVIESIGAKDILRVANKYLSPNKLLELGYLPQDEKK